MGLDITAYRDMKFVRTVSNDDDGTDYDNAYEENLAVLYINPDFPGRSDSLVDRGGYSYKESTKFRAGSYGSYNGWRNNLAQLAGYVMGKSGYYDAPIEIWDGTVTEGPFYELIWFSDCEGVIGAEIAEKLYQDFVTHDTAAQKFDTIDSQFYEKYQQWSIAFEMARHNGCVMFH